MSPAPGHLRRMERGVKGMALALARALFRQRHSDPIRPGAVRRILVIRQHNQLGDMLCATPLLRALRSRYPEAFIALMTSPVNHAVMLHHPALNETILFDKREFLSGGRIHPLRLVRFLRSLRTRRFDLALVPATVSMSATSDILAYVSGARWRIGVGSLEGKANPSAFFYTESVRLSWAGQSAVHQTVRNMEVARSLSLPDPGPDLNLALTLEEREHALKTGPPRDGRKRIAFHVGAGKVPNRWPAERYASIINIVVRELGFDVIMVSGPMDGEPVLAVHSALAVGVQLIENESIRKVASCLSVVDLLVSNDTGIMHVGAAVGVPVLSLFGPTDPGQWAPVGPRHRYIKGGFGDIRDITAEEVLRNIKEMAGSTGAPAG
ncbi:partial ADP-heptose--LPS heptosyltransferase 2, partial [Anaerolineae bacterium]